MTTQVDKDKALGVYVAVGTQSVGTLPLMPNLGSANRVTVRYVCDGTSPNWFRAWADVDVIGSADLSNKMYSVGKELLAANDTPPKIH